MDPRPARKRTRRCGGRSAEGVLGGSTARPGPEPRRKWRPRALNTACLFLACSLCRFHRHSLLRKVRLRFYSSFKILEMSRPLLALGAPFSSVWSTAKGSVEKGRARCVRCSQRAVQAGTVAALALLFLLLCMETTFKAS